jgi:hypothetical protein
MPLTPIKAARRLIHDERNSLPTRTGRCTGSDSVFAYHLRPRLRSLGEEGSELGLGSSLLWPRQNPKIILVKLDYTATEALTTRTSVKSLSPSTPNCRPIPDCFAPPNKTSNGSAKCLLT